MRARRKEVQQVENLKELETQLNALTSQGKILEGLDQFYADNCSFQEGNSEPRVGKATDRAFLEGFFASLKKFNGATLHAQAIGDNVTLSEWTFDMEGPNGPILWNEILRRQWANGKVVSERFYTAS